MVIQCSVSVNEGIFEDVVMIQDSWDGSRVRVGVVHRYAGVAVERRAVEYTQRYYHLAETVYRHADCRCFCSVLAFRRIVRDCFLRYFKYVMED